MRTHCLVFTLIFAACAPVPPDIRIHSILVSTPLDGDAVFRDTLRQEATSYIFHHARGIQLVDKVEQATHHMEIQLVVEDENIALAITLRPIRPELPAFQASASIYDDPSIARERGRAFVRAWLEIQTERTLMLAPEATLLHEASLGERVDLRYFAIQALGRRKIIGAVPVLISIVNQNDDPGATLRAIGSLVELHDQRAIQPIIELTRHQEPEYLSPLLYALAAIGGPEAEGFLVLMASGHHEQSVRDTAAEALKEMQRKDAKPLSTP